MIFPLSDIQIEISGKCNARCPYCITGQQNNQHKPTGKFIDPDVFEQAISFLYNKKYIDIHTVIALFNYGEPLLHPGFDQILDIMESFGNPYELSTNASIKLSESTIKKMNGLSNIQFSMSGFSQQSYDRIHGFDFQRIKNNVTCMVNNIHKWHPETECVMKLQVYSFNENEVEDMLRFSRELGMTVVPLHALYANLQQQIDFIMSYQATKQLPSNSEQLWYYLPELFSSGIEEKTCLQHSSVVIDENLDVAVCCMATKLMPEYRLCHLYELTEEHLSQRVASALCRKCMKNGVSKSICRTPSYKKHMEYEKVLYLNAVSKGRDIIVVGEGGLKNSFQNLYSEFYLETHSVSYLDDKIFEAAERDRRSPYWVLADSKYGNFRSLLVNKGKKENLDFLSYNTYLR